MQKVLLETIASADKKVDFLYCEYSCRVLFLFGKCYVLRATKVRCKNTSVFLSAVLWLGLGWRFGIVVM